MLEKRSFYIDGRWVAPALARDCEVVNPSDETPCAVISLGAKDDVDRAVAAARAAFAGWSETPPSARADLLEKLADIYDSRVDEMAAAISLEMGAPITMARKSQAAAGASHLRETIRVARDFVFDAPFSAAESDCRILREPIGVCALITPWNWPMNQVTLKVAPALAAGCVVVLKPSEIAPLSSLLFAEMVDAAGFPRGVFNLVNGDGEVGRALSSHPGIDMVSFTGSTRAGEDVSKNAAATIKRVSLELGGKGANIVFADADEDAVARGARHCFNNSGQSCNAPTRMLVERAAYDRAVATAARIAAETEVDVAAKEGAHIGPVVSATQRDKIRRLIAAGIAEGARLVAGGADAPPRLDRGYFVRPTVFADVTNEMTVAREEIFGPVLSIMPFDDEEEATRIANDTPYGLGNYIQTRDAAKAARIARRLRSGMVQINGHSLADAAPFGGYKRSGNGREGGAWGIEEFLETKAVSGWE